MLEKKAKIQSEISCRSRCWTQPPDKCRSEKATQTLADRLMNTQFMHKKMLSNPKYEEIGLLGLPYLAFRVHRTPDEVLDLIWFRLFFSRSLQ
jgi:hypothetical protein